MPSTSYVPRLLDGLLDELLADAPALLLVGPRACGKTTTALRRAASVLRLADRATAESVERDPFGVLAGFSKSPLLIDEWQLAPDVLVAVKQAVDDDPRPGRFILTGSSRADLQAAGWPATGRVIRVPMSTMTQRELIGNPAATSLVDLMFEDRLDEVRSGDAAPDLRWYIDTALRSGFPEANRMNSDRTRRAWLASYVDQVVLRDVALAGGEASDPRRLRRYLRALAASTAGVVAHKTIYDAADISRVTAAAYDNLLELLYVSEQVPAWTTSRLSRLQQTSKRYLYEPALLGAIWQLDARTVLRDADLVGRLIDTFVTAQLRAECVVADAAPTLHHLRQADGRHEADLILEGPAGTIVAVEIKAAATVNADAARHLRWLRDNLGDQFAGGVVFHTGPYAYRLDDKIWSLPIAAIWGAPPGSPPS